MKKISFLVIFFAVIYCSCQQAEQESEVIPEFKADSTLPVKKVYKLADYTHTKPEVVKAMAAAYDELIKKTPGAGIQQINMDGEILASLLSESIGLKLVAAATPGTEKITMFLEFWTGGDSFTFINIDTLFKITQRGMRGKPALCPPPSACELPFQLSAASKSIEEGEVQAMAELYNRDVQTYPEIAMRQVNMDALVLSLILYSTDGIKLICAFDQRKLKTTMIMQLWRADTFGYYDISNIFTPELKGMRGQEALCPPPAMCELP